MHGGQAEGRLLGGNLDTMQGIWGSPYMPAIREGDILLLEDSLKDAATVERSFSLLKLNGVFDRVGGVILGKIMCFVTHGKINPLIGSAGVSAVPMAARVSQKVGAEADPTNFLLMHAMGPNVAGVIGTAVVAGTFMAIFGVF